MTDQYYGQRQAQTNGSDVSRSKFLARQETGRVRTMIPVKVIAVKGGGVGAPPTVNVKPLVNQIDGQGNSTEHGTVFNIPVSRLQGGGNAIINDPAVGDVGYIMVADRDISSVKANAGQQSNPGSYRRFNFADGVYVGAILNSGTPDQYVHFTSDGIEISDKNGNKITMTSSGINITAPAGVNLNGLVIDQNGKATGPADIIANGISLDTHVHGGVQPGPATTGEPE